MPHLSVHVLESDLVGHETALIEKLTDAVVAVYGEWARSIAVVQLIGLPPNRWGIGGAPARAPSPSVTFGITEAAFSRPDADEIVARLVSGVTDAVVDVLNEPPTRLDRRTHLLFAKGSSTEALAPRHPHWMLMGSFSMRPRYSYACNLVSERRRQ